MDSAKSLEWFAENVDFFESILDDDLSKPVPTCPGWSILDLLAHLSFGLGVCYPIAAAALPTASTDSVFAGADTSSIGLQGSEAVEAFRTNVRNCVTALEAMDPEAPCWTYAGPGTVSFWIRRAASETAIHRYDVEQAYGTQFALAPERATDGIDEALEFAFPFAGQKIGAPRSRLQIAATDSDLQRSIGTGETECAITGDTQSLFLALWGREQEAEIQVDGDRAAADEWLTLVARAFAGR